VAAHRRHLTVPGGRFTGEVLLRSSRSFDICAAVDDAGRSVVVKRARHLAGLDGKRFRREARLGRSLRHEGLASVLGDAPDWIAFDRLEGSLLDRPEGVPGLAALTEVAETLAHLHALGVVHRDLKPAHIMFRGGRAVLIDLGVAGLVGSEDPLDAGEIVGSPAWMAPEQMLGAAPAPSADIWSFSALAHRLLAGRPLHAGTADAVLEARRTGAEPKPDFSSLADRRLADALHAGFAAPEDRPSARELAEALSEAGLRHAGRATTRRAGR
jgi:serine/threonine-protein kinase